MRRVSVPPNDAFSNDTFHSPITVHSDPSPNDSISSHTQLEPLRQFRRLTILNCVVRLYLELVQRRLHRSSVEIAILVYYDVATRKRPTATECFRTECSTDECWLALIEEQVALEGLVCQVGKRSLDGGQQWRRPPAMSDLMSRYTL